MFPFLHQLQLRSWRCGEDKNSAPSRFEPWTLNQYNDRSIMLKNRHLLQQPKSWDLHFAFLDSYYDFQNVNTD